MAYKKHEWAAGETITSDSLNTSEEQLESVSSEIETARNTYATLRHRLDAMDQATNSSKQEFLSTANSIYNNIDNVARDLSGLRNNLNTEVVSNGYVENGTAYYTNTNGEVLFAMTGIGGGGGGGGGGGPSTNATFTARKVDNWSAKTVTKGASCIASITWSSVEDDIPTGDGTLKVIIAGITKAVLNVSQGVVNVELGSYLNEGDNSVILELSDVYGQTRRFSYTVSSVVLTISSTLDVSVPYTTAFDFSCTLTGDVRTRIIHIKLDGAEIVTTTILTSSYTTTIPALAHGSHTLEVWYSAELNNEEISSNILYYEFMFVHADNHDPIITSNFNTKTISQYSRTNIYYRVYNPDSATTDVIVYENEIEKEALRVDATQQVYVFRASTAGTSKIRLYVNENIYKDFIIEVTPSIIDVEAESQNLSLYLSAAGRNNNQSNRTEWKWNDIQAQFNNFTWILDGWQQDSAGSNVLRVQGDARVTIPYKLFGTTNVINTGRTIEIEFATSEVKNYNEPIITCYTPNDHIGLQITSQEVTVSGAQSSINTVYKDNEHIRLSITISKQGDNRLMLVYIDGIMSRAVQYARGENFKQGTPLDISIGSNSCAVDIYNIRVYDSCLTSRQVVNNWIADTQDGTDMLDRYVRNQIYTSSDTITIDSLKNTIAYMILSAPGLPPAKGSKVKDVYGSFIDPADPTRSFTYEGCEIDAQGTSSSVYYIKNIDMKFKKGFTITSNNQKVDSYSLRPGSIGFNRFVLKADVASSESVNNTGLTMFYNDTCPYQTPEMEANSKVRWGIEGRPIVMFWNEVNDAHPEGYLHFMGKYNFNLPKRAPAPYGYADGQDESWEWEQNNSANVKFQDVDFSSAVDEEGKIYYPWYDDFEARFPDDTYRDITQLKGLLSFVHSTYREQATYHTFDSPIVFTINGLNLLSNFPTTDYQIISGIDEQGQITGPIRVQFNADTPAYRLIKFRNDFPKYAELESAIYYYLFTEMFLMIDSRAKNMFIGFHGSTNNDTSIPLRRKAVFEPYDMDTALGTNNSGVLMFSYNLEDTDKVDSVITGDDETEGMANVFNAQDSVLWCNLRDAFPDEIADMYITLRGGATPVWSYEKIENWFENHQSAWCESIFNEDAKVKYIGPLTDVGQEEAAGKEVPVSTARYLTMLQGSKKEQRKWWLSNRFRYMDSKYLTGDAASKTIDLRLFNSGDLTIKTAIDMYSAVRFGLGSTPQRRRVTANTATTYTYDRGATAQEMETSIYSADLITDVGDLSIFFPNECNFSKARRLTRLQIGNGAEGYSNNNLQKMEVKNSTMLEYIDCRNCPRLAINIDLEGSPRLKEAYFDNTSITGIDLAEGGEIHTLHLPGTITALTLINLPNLQELVIPDYSNITRFMFSKVSNTVLDPIATLDRISEHANINLQNLELSYHNYDEISALYDKFDQKGGVSREYNRNTNDWEYHLYDNAKNTITGVIQVDTITGAQLSILQQRYPYMKIDADEVLSTVYYYNFEGTELLGTEENIRKNGTAAGNLRPEHAPDEKYTYKFIGWSRNKESGTADSNALKNIYGDRNVYAAYELTYQMYNVGFYKRGGIEGGTYSDYEGWRLQYGSAYNYNVPTATFIESSGLNAEDFVFLYWSTLEGDDSVIFSPGMIITRNYTFYPVWKDTRTKLTQQLNDTLLELVDNTLPNIGSYTFYNVSRLAKINLQNENGITIGKFAFSGASNINSLLLTYPNLEEGSFENSTFNNPITLTNATIDRIGFQRSAGPECTIKNSSLGARSFANSNWQKIFVDNSDVGEQAFLRVEGLTQPIEINDCNINITALSSTTLPVNITGTKTNFVPSSEGNPCSFNDVIIDSSTIPAFPANSYYGSRIHNFGGAFYVTDSLINEYKAATNWCEFADKIYKKSEYPVSDFSTIKDSWETIFQNLENGTYKTKYHVGDYKQITLTSEDITYTTYAYLLAIDSDVSATGEKIKTSWTLLHNPIRDGFSDRSITFKQTSQINFDYTQTSYRNTYNTSWPNYFPEAIRSHIVPAKKKTTGYTNGNMNFTETIETVWPLSTYELGLSTNTQYTGPVYQNILKDLSSYHNTIGETGTRSWTRTRDFGYAAATDGYIITLNDIICISSTEPYFQIGSDDISRTGEPPFIGFCLN